MPLFRLIPLLSLALVLATPVVTPGTPGATPEPIVLEQTLAIESYTAGEEPETIAVADIGGPLQMRPGEERTLAVGTYECCYVFEPREVDVIWTISPVEGVRIDDSGLLSIGEDVPDGTVVSVTANRDPAGPSASVAVHVYAAEAQPLVGIWREQSQISCGTGEGIAPAEPIGELRFDADGTFSVTWHPFEVYRDYWGTYEADPATGDLKLTVESGNIPTPAGFDGTGAFEVTSDGSLVLHDIWLGSPPGGSMQVDGCGHVFD